MNPADARTTRLRALAMCCALVLAACGGGGKSSDAASPTAAGTPTAQEAEVSATPSAVGGSDVAGESDASEDDPETAAAGARATPDPGATAPAASSAPAQAGGATGADGSTSAAQPAPPPAGQQPGDQQPGAGGPGQPPPAGQQPPAQQPGTQPSGAQQQPGAAEAPSPTGTAPGLYVADIDGTATSPLGSRDIDGQIRQTWEPTGPDGRQTGRTEGGDDASPGGGAMTQVVQHVDGAVLLVEQIAEGDDEGDLSFRPDEPVQLAPLGAQPGTTWAWNMRSISGRTTIALRAELLRREDLTVDGQTVTATVIRSTLRIENPDFRAVQQRTTWLDEEALLTLREESSTEGTATFNGAPVEFGAETVQVLRSRTPA